MAFSVFEMVEPPPAPMSKPAEVEVTHESPQLIEAIKP